jgi:REP element-mobilizing transposase RayT
MKKKRAQRQLKFPALREFTKLEHGGEQSLGKRKTARPLAVKRPVHLVLRSSKATGKLSMLAPAHHDLVQSLIWKYAAKNQIKIHRFANAGNHLHLLIQAKTKAGFRAFLRTISGLIARLITGAVKGRPAANTLQGNVATQAARFQTKFWDHLAFTRVVSWGKDFKKTCDYVIQNVMEACGLGSKRKQAWITNAILIGFS